MAENRFFINQLLIEHQEIPLSLEELHHLRVMRKKEGDIIELVNGQNQFAKATILKLDKKASSFRIHTVESKKEKTRKITLCQALFESNKIEWIVEKTTELDVDNLFFFPSTRSKKNIFSDHEKTRLTKHAISSMKQSNRWDLPKIQFFPSLEALPLTSPLYFGDVDEKTFCSFDPLKNCMIVIGPPSGFTKEEEKHLLSNNAIGISLGKNTLRAETAAIVAIALAAL